MRRKAKLAAADAIAAVNKELELEKEQMKQDYWEIRVTSNPKEIPRDFNPAQSFNWLTNKMDDFLSSFHEDFDGSGGMKDNENGTSTVNMSAATSKDDMSSGCGWLGHCWGSPYLMNKVAGGEDTDPTYESSYDDDGSGDSSQPSLSRIDQVLEVDALFDTVSDITSAPSIDDSDSESEKSSESNHS